MTAEPFTIQISEGAARRALLVLPWRHECCWHKIPVLIVTDRRHPTEQEKQSA